MKQKVYGIAAAVLLCTAMTELYGVDKMGADYAAPAVASFLEGLALPEGELYAFTLEDTEKALGVSADNGICVFELVDCMYRYLAPRNMRVSISGDYIRNLHSKFYLGEAWTRALIRLDDILRLDTGAILSEDQNALDMFLPEPSSKYIEIGNGFYEAKFGFKTLTPNLFADAYGLTVRWFVVKTPVLRMEMYGPNLGAIYVKAINRPKKWEFGLITRLQ
jgi:hypothetical protein